MHATNSLEKMVPATVARLTGDHPHLSNCESCKSDVLALALSSLAPGYASTELGRILTRIDAETASGKAKIAVAVLDAIDVVEQNPHHDAG